MLLTFAPNSTLFSSLPFSISRISFSILPSRSNSLRVIFLVWLLLCLRSFLYSEFCNYLY